MSIAVYRNDLLAACGEAGFPLKHASTIAWTVWPQDSTDDEGAFFEKHRERWIWWLASFEGIFEGMPKSWMPPPA